LSANRKSYMPRRLAQQRMTFSDLEWLFHSSRAISEVAELLVMVWLHYEYLWSYNTLLIASQKGSVEIFGLFTAFSPTNNIRHHRFLLWDIVTCAPYRWCGGAIDRASDFWFL